LSTRLVVPANITIIALPPKCPELNPVENVWQYRSSVQEMRIVAQRQSSGPHRLSDLDAQFERLAMDLRGAPERVLETHSSDQRTSLPIRGRPPGGRDFHRQ